MFVGPQTEVYEGMIVGENARQDDMDVNPTKEKKLTNMRQSSSDVLVPLIPHKVLSLEQALEFCREDECVEVTPANVRIRKVELSMSEREKYRGRRAKAAREDSRSRPHRERLGSAVRACVVRIARDGLRVVDWPRRCLLHVDRLARFGVDRLRDWRGDRATGAATAFGVVA